MYDQIKENLLSSCIKKINLNTKIVFHYPENTNKINLAFTYVIATTDTLEAQVAHDAASQRQSSITMNKR